MRCVFVKSKIYVKIVIKKPPPLGKIHKNKAAVTLVTDTDNRTCMPLLCQHSKITANTNTDIHYSHSLAHNSLHDRKCIQQETGFTLP